MTDPLTYGRTPWIEAWRVAACPACYRPAISVIERELGEAQRMVEYRCAAAHVWRTSWSGHSLWIHREAAPEPAGYHLRDYALDVREACGADDIDD